MQIIKVSVIKREYEITHILKTYNLVLKSHYSRLNKNPNVPDRIVKRIESTRYQDNDLDRRLMG